MRLDFCPSECTAAEQVEGTMESALGDVLDDSRARVGPCMGGQTVFCCKRDTGYVQRQASRWVW